MAKTKRTKKASTKTVGSKKKTRTNSKAAKASSKLRAASSAEKSTSGRFKKYCFVLLLTGVMILLWMSLLSYSPTDPPSPEVHPPRLDAANKVGIVGAYMAYYVRYWVGAGAYAALLFGTIAATVMMLGGRISDLRWRLVGVVLLVSATSTGAFLTNPDSQQDVWRTSAGILGAGAGGFLHAKFGPTSSWVIVLLTLCIGVMLTADHLVLRIPHLGKKALKGSKRIPKFLAAVRTPACGNAPASEAAPSPRVTAMPAKSSPAVAVKPKLAARPAPAKPVRAKLPSPTSNNKKTTIKQAPTNFEIPSFELLAEPTTGYSEAAQMQASHKKLVLQQLLNDFNVGAEVVDFMTGPVITMFELMLAPGVKVSQIANLANDIARSMAVPGVRIVSPIIGKDTVGIEVPNLDKEIVRIKELMTAEPDADKKMHLPLYLGKDAGGSPIIADLSSMPHMLIAGTTGSGKSVCINAIIMSILMTRSPDDVRFILVDPKMVEMAAYEEMPHLLCPIINDMRRAEDILEWAATRMDERYELFKEARVRNIHGFNNLSKKEIYERFGVESEEDRARVPTHIPHYVIIIDELADLMMTSGKEVEGHIIRIAQKARAVGIHLVLATQRPSVNVVTGLIKSNMPCRVSFRVASRQESRIVLDQNGAEVLMGQGDMLLLQPGTSNLIRAQGTFIDDSEIKSVVKTLRKKGGPTYNNELVHLNSRSVGQGTMERDDLFDKAVEIVLTTKRGSVSLLQRRLQVGYSRASRIIDQMADSGLLGEYKGSQARECLITLEDWQSMQSSIHADQSGASSISGEPTSV